MLISDKLTSAIHARFHSPSRHTFITLSQWKHVIKFRYQNLISRLDDIIVASLFPRGDMAWENEKSTRSCARRCFRLMWIMTKSIYLEWIVPGRKTADEQVHLSIYFFL